MRRADPSLHTLAAPAQRARANLALAFAAAFAALILLNYILQTTFVPALWNALMIAMAAAVIAATRRRSKPSAASR